MKQCGAVLLVNEGLLVQHAPRRPPGVNLEATEPTGPAVAMLVLGKPTLPPECPPLGLQRLLVAGIGGLDLACERWGAFLSDGGKGPGGVEGYPQAKADPARATPTRGR